MVSTRWPVQRSHVSAGRGGLATDGRGEVEGAWGGSGVAPASLLVAGRSARCWSSTAQSPASEGGGDGGGEPTDRRADGGVRRADAGGAEGWSRERGTDEV